MKDFDVVREEGRVTAIEERKFTLGGEVFVRRVAVRPEAMIEWEDMTNDVTAGEALAITDRTLLAFIEDIDDAHARFRAVRESDENPVTVADMGVVLVWLIAESTGRPTAALSPSTDGPGAQKAGTQSTDDSLSQVEAMTGAAV